jgi:hypothetical protein
MSNDPTVIHATAGTCPACNFTTLNRWSIGATAAAAHTRDAHPDIADRRYYFPEQAWHLIPTDWHFTAVAAVIAADAGQLALFDPAH